MVPAGTYRLTLPASGEDAGLTGDLDLLDAVAIQGAGADGRRRAGRRVLAC